MALTEIQIQELKDQLRAQVSNLSPQQKEAALKQIDSLSPEALEAMVKQQQEKQSNSIFRMIVNKETSSVIIGENSEALAVLDINPISRGHSLIIPKKAVTHAKDIPKEAIDLAEDLGKKIGLNLKAKSTKIEPDTQFGEVIVHLIPIYDSDLTLDSPRKKATLKELEEIRKALETIRIEKKVEKIKVKKPRKQKPIKLPMRIA